MEVKNHHSCMKNSTILFHNLNRLQEKVPLLNKGQVFELLRNQDGHTHHFVVDFVEVNFADFVNDAFTFKCYECKPCVHNRQQPDQPPTTSTGSLTLLNRGSKSHHDNQVRSRMTTLSQVQSTYCFWWHVSMSLCPHEN